MVIYADFPEFTLKTRAARLAVFRAFSKAQSSSLPWSPRAELDCLIYNDPLGYADLILNGDPEEYLKNVAGSHGLEI